MHRGDADALREQHHGPVVAGKGEDAAALEEREPVADAIARERTPEERVAAVEAGREAEVALLRQRAHRHVADELTPDLVSLVEAGDGDVDVGPGFPGEAVGDVEQEGPDAGRLVSRLDDGQRVYVKRHGGSFGLGEVDAAKVTGAILYAKSRFTELLQASSGDDGLPGVVCPGGCAGFGW